MKLGTRNSKPNVVLITLDECKASVLGSYGNSDAYTPHMDQLSRQSVQFDRAFCTFPKCAPSRAALITGRYPHVEGHRTLPGLDVRRGENNLIWEMKKQGYKTAMFGKNHTIDQEWLSDCFDEYHHPRKGLDVPWQRRPFETDDDLFRAFYRGPFADVEEMSDYHATQDGMAFIEKHSQEPFLLLLNYNAPHPPYTDIPPFIDRIRERHIRLPQMEPLDETPDVLRAYREVYELEHLTEQQWRKVVEAYYSLVSFIDDQVGQVLGAIDRLGLAEETIVVLTSDHGDFAGEHGAVEKWDTMFYDCLVRVPLYIRWPEHIQADRKAEAMVENVDIAPTLMELCGLGVPKWMQGQSLASLLRGETDQHKKAVFCEGGVEEKLLHLAVQMDSEEHARRHPNYHWKQKLLLEHPSTLCRAKMIRTERWKLVYRVDGRKELYDLLHDPEEFHNVADTAQHKEVLIDLMEQLLQWSIRTETDYPLLDALNS